MKEVAASPGLRMDAEFYLCPTKEVDKKIERTLTTITNGQRRLLRLQREREEIMADVTEGLVEYRQVFYEKITGAATEHGNQHDEGTVDAYEMEIGDLQQLLGAAMDQLSLEQLNTFAEDERVKDVIEWGEGK